ncbi:unnamed protein product [Brachionus calyciflorus]|uniref:MULE transposase domain-containing protein n=1 Tax=Brachionus calyciflorus TaxID=104777 RepID=A0A813QH91_9BILA|nr:unnamed protein product [Brachionus calyciflorus]
MIDSKTRMLIFATERNFQLLSDYQNWLCHGTFDAAPSIFLKLFTLHILKNRKNLPLVLENGLAVQYRDLTTNENPIRLYSKILASLAFVPPEDVEDAFVLAQNNAPKVLKKVNEYFETNYIGDKRKTKVPSRKSPRFRINWNCYERTKAGLPRINNNLERWHNGLQSNFWLDINLLKLLESISI